MSKYDEMIRIFYKEISSGGRPGRLGKVFKTDKNYYFLDAGTGKVACVTKDVFKILKVLMEGDSVEDLFNLRLDPDSLEKAILEIKNAIKEENILSAPPLKTLTGAAVTDLTEIMENGVENITLEVTEKCNLRCKYCIYNPSHPEYREFGHNDMSWDTVKKSIDFLKNHSKYAEHVNIGFYGGEPLLNFELIQRCVEYAKSIFSKDLIFAMTTNATLVDDNIAKFLMENDFNIIISLDGPEELHNENRIMIDETGSYEKTVKGAKILFGMQEKMGKKAKVGFNMVISGPDYEEKYNKVQKFIEKEEWIPKDVMILTSSVDRGPKDSEYYLPQSKEEKEFSRGSYDPLYNWEEKYRKKIDSSNENKPLFTDGIMDKGQVIIHKRLLSEKPVKAYGMNGCCVPGQRRIYVTVDGEFLLCEKVGNIPSIGNVDTGFNKERIKKLYVEEFIKGAKEYCKDCWAVNLCSLCYVNCYDQKGSHFDYRHNSCRSERLYLENNLIKYHTVLEENPEQLMAYNDMDFH